MRRPSQTIPGLALLLSVCLCAACDPVQGTENGSPSEDATAPAPEWPAGTVMTLDGEPIGQTEVDALAELVSKLYPQYTRPQLRRLALTNKIFLLHALRERYSESRAATRSEAEGALALAAGGEELGGSIEAAGGWRDLGFELWSELVVRAPEKGAWTGPIEIPGRHLLVRIQERPPAGRPEMDGWRVSILEFPYLPEERRQPAIEAALDACALQILDPAWNEIVPEGWKYRMSPNSGGG